MIEIIDNSIQLTVLACCCIYSAIQAIRRNTNAWFLLTCFYGAYALGLVFWLLFLFFYSDWPHISPVSDLSWMASVLFLIVLQNTISLPEERAYRPSSAWVAPACSTALCFFFFQWGDYLLNILWAALMGVCGYNALRGLLYARQKSDGTRNNQYIYMAVLAFILLEYGLWVTSGFWKEISLSNPYYWIDFLMTATFVTFMPALRKRVAE